MAHGHRKLTAALSTFAAGEVVGVDLVVFFWGLLGVGPMPEDVATNIMTLLAFVALYYTDEDEVAPERELLLTKVVEPAPGQVSASFESAEVPAPRVDDR